MIGYNPHSRFAADLKAKPWYEAMSEPGIRIGRTDPKLDPKGALTVALLNKAETTYKQPGLAQRVLGAPDNPAQVLPEETLLGRLQSGQLDAGFFYSTETSDAHIPVVELPPDIRPKARYTATVLRNAPNPDGAAQFVAFLLGAPGRAMLQAHGLDLGDARRSRLTPRPPRGSSGRRCPRASEPASSRRSCSGWPASSALYIVLPFVAGVQQAGLADWRSVELPTLERACAVSAASATVATALIALGGIPLGYVLARVPGRWMTVLGFVVQLPLALPPLASGVLLLFLLGAYSPAGRLLGDVTDTFWGIVMAQTFVAAPFLIIAARSAFAAVDPVLEDVAATLGHGQVGALPARQPAARMAGDASGPAAGLAARLRRVRGDRHGRLPSVHAAGVHLRRVWRAGVAGNAAGAGAHSGGGGRRHGTDPAPAAAAGQTAIRHAAGAVVGSGLPDEWRPVPGPSPATDTWSFASTSGSARSRWTPPGRRRRDASRFSALRDRANR